MIKDEYLTVSQTAEVLSFTRQTVYRYIVAGKLKAETVGRIRLINKCQIKSLLYEFIDEINERIDTLEGKIQKLQ